MQLRDYQIAALNRIDADLQNEQFVLLSAIMGAGKTVMVSRLINKYYKESDRRFLILAHKQELVLQFYKTFKNMTDIPTNDIGIVCAGLSSRNIRRVTIGTVQTFIKHIEQYSCNLLVVDECHRINFDAGQYKEIIDTLLEKNNKLRVLGVTATEYRHQFGYIYGDKHIEKGTVLFPKLNYKIGYGKLMQAGYLVPLKGHVAKYKEYDKDIKDISIHGDYVLEELGEMMEKQVYLESARDKIAECCGEFKHVCVFCCTIEHAEMLQELVPDSTIVHSKLSKEQRQANMELWTSGQKRIMMSINILSEGFDFPPLDCLVMARPTRSTGLFLQSVGRVLRTHEGKEGGFLLDLTDNTSRFGTNLDQVKVFVPKTVEKMIEDEKKQEDIKICPGCGAELHIKLKVCYECQYRFDQMYADKKVTTLEEVDFTGGDARSEPITVGVIEMYDDIWQSNKSKKWLYRVRLETTEGYSASIWLCFPEDGYKGYAVQRGAYWWDKLTMGATVPQAAMHALENRDYLWKPDWAMLNVSKRYPEVLAVGYNGGFCVEVP